MKSKTRQDTFIGKVLVAALSAVLLASAVQASAAVRITGAGATFPYPVYSRWAYDYNKETGVELNYQSIGSGGGIKQIKAKTVDFGASDAPLQPEELDEAGLVQWPMIMGGVVPVVNIAGIRANQLTLSGEVLADIFLNRITRWNDARIQALNPGVDLPDDAIAVIHRADGSGTTWIFTNYLSKVSPAWKSEVGNNKAVAWPIGLGGKGNEGVAAFVGKVPGAIGYVEYAYALQNHMTSVKLVNHDGHAVAPTAANFQAAAAGADWKNARGYYMVLTNQPGADAWPITGASFILMYRKQSNTDQAREVLKFLKWSYENGRKAATELDYVPMPASVVDMIERTWATEMTDTKGKPVWRE